MGLPYGVSVSPRPRRLDHLLSACGYCSRSDARLWLHGGRVTVDGKPTTDPDQRVDPDRVRIDGEPVESPDGIVALFNKPPGRVCTHEEGTTPNIYQLLPERWTARNPAIASVGRLDKDATGLLVMTDQGDLIHKWTSPRHHVPRVYEVTVDKPLDPALVPQFASGELPLPGDPDPCRPAKLEITGDCTARVELTEGRYHQVKRMFAGQGWQVLALHRVRFGEFEIGDLAPGAWRIVPLPPE